VRLIDNVGSNLLFVFTGSIAAYKACEAVSRLVQRGHGCVAWRLARLKFIGPATLEGLTGSPVLAIVRAGPGARPYYAHALGRCGRGMSRHGQQINRLAAGLRTTCRSAVPGA